MSDNQTTPETPLQTATETTPPPRRSNFFVGNALWLLLFIAIAFVLYQRANQPAVQTPPPNTPSTYKPLKDETNQLKIAHVAPFTFKNQLGETITEKELLGKPWVVNFIFTKCAHTCPKLTTAMRDLDRQVKDVDVRLVSITVDPDRDTPEQLKGYAEIYQAKPERWWFLTGSKEQLYGVIKNTFSQTVIEEVNPKLGYEFAHSNRFIHVDAKGKVIGTYNGMDETQRSVLASVLKKKRKTPRNHQFFKVIEDKSSDQPANQKTNEKKKTTKQKIVTQTSYKFLAASPIAPAPPVITPEEKTGTHSAAPHSAAPHSAAPHSAAPGWLRIFPTINASLNGLAGILLVVGFVLIKQGKEEAHKKTMLTAFGVSVVFLLCYLTYHALMQAYTGSAHRSFEGTGMIKTIYLIILFTHLILAMLVPFLAVATIWSGLKNQRAKHLKLAKITFPIWLYVSITGVVVYFMLYHYTP